MNKLLLIFALAILMFSCSEEKPRVLVFSKTKGFRHESITAGKAALIKMGMENNFSVDTSEMAEDFTGEKLKRYRAIVFLSTTGDVLTHQQQNEMMKFIQAGGGFAGIHAAADTEYDWWWYGKLVGAYFKSHPNIQEAVVKRAQLLGSEIDAKLPFEWKKTDEWYNYRKISEDITVLYQLDESSYQGGENGNNHPIAWFQEFDGGRSFYTGLGHTVESYSDSLFLSHVLSGINYAIGNTKPDFSKARAKEVPEENRFTKNVLGYFFDEPTELTILPDGRIIFLERKGGVKLYDPKTDSIRKINQFKVNTTFEDGMIGLTSDPGFDQNHWLYIFYSHPERSANVVSRFTFDGDSIDRTSEKVLLEVAVQRKQCCHTGGSLLFGPDGNLYASTGDNTSPFESDGYSPSDEGKDRFPFDAQKSSANPNDLRGKVLRIHPEPDGTYTIPAGNLFAKGEEGTRPEIYAMGCRNPYRISIDEKTGYLYWGEVGPDAGNDDPERGPRGYDEVNQAKGPGYFGWPYFIGNNYAYADFDFEKKKIGTKPDPTAPVNNSPNNTGKQQLPPAVPAFIWYPYATSPDFPLVKEGGRNAMAGPVYYSEKFKGKSGAFPDYLDNKLIVYDWMRNWIRLVTMDDQGRIMDIEPWMDNLQFNNIIDMAFGPDGKLYVLEYGTAWFKQNIDARLSRIDFNSGNRPPVAVLTADKDAGSVPLSVNFSSGKTADPDGDKITYELSWNDQKTKSDNGDFKVTFDKPGLYKVLLTASDNKGEKSTHEMRITAGNEPPAIAIAVEGNQMFFIPGVPSSYKITVNDFEDGSTEDNRIKVAEVKVSVDYLKEGFDLAKIEAGHQQPALPGKALIAESDCKSCHFVDQKSAGPSYRDIAFKYKSDHGALEYLSTKILNGGSGVWGEVPMAAHPQISKEQANTMVEYILSLANEVKKALQLTGQLNLAREAKGIYVISASYDDKGNGQVPSLNGSGLRILKAPVLTGAEAVDLQTVRPLNAGVMVAVSNVKHGSSLAFRKVDLSGVNRLEFTIVEIDKATFGGEIELRSGSAQGEIMGRVKFSASPKILIQEGIYMRSSSIAMKGVSGPNDLVLVFVNASAGDRDLFIFSNMTLAKK